MSPIMMPLPHNTAPQESDAHPSNPPIVSWLHIMMEAHMDGMLLLTNDGQWVAANQVAKELCDRLSPHARRTYEVPKEIKRCCQNLRESQDIYPDNTLVLDSEVTTDRSFTLRIRAQWFRPQRLNSDATTPNSYLALEPFAYQAVRNLDVNEEGGQHSSPESQCILVILEDNDRSMRNRAISEAQQFGLSPREQEVWILRRTNHAMQDIADTLVISLNTVKKHLKSIYLKQRMVSLLDS